jgi:HSP20 family protein
MLNEMQRVSESLPRNQFSPSFDVREDKDAYVLEGELPGMKREDVRIEFRDDQTVTVKGHREYRREEGRRPGMVEEGADKEEGGKTIENGSAAANNATESKEVTQTNTGGKEVELAQSMPKHTYWVSERSTGEFSRSFSFPNRVDQDKVTASLKDGVLRLVLPKVAKKERARRIEIE